MLEINTSAQFRRDVKRIKKQGLDTAPLKEAIALLAGELPLPRQARDHSLGGNWTDYRELHLAPDWLLIYRIDGGVLYLTQTGSHSYLFGK
ncbi:addiction module toxin, RelE/StbE family [Pyramidobacter piscolens W5455]|uniref:Addiction module toxin, RelE/StbE family n=1 Tax=Pyramidobacter piscolens W5455 TaxID=352165 RepID=A0ABP2HVR2_9BACT|nr:type II toxin-antitoxin system YafQ family toxin [Pyramidobacter piscolens]EFB91338.1 addiction module toxin, RelE/StbE family [Pyramidobacter piscolens W5455]